MNGMFIISLLKSSLDQGFAAAWNFNKNVPELNGKGTLDGQKWSS